MGGVLRADDGALGSAEARLSLVGGDLTKAAEPTREAGARALRGAGQFAAELDDGIVSFAVSWRAALGVLGRSANAVSRQIDLFRSTTTEADERLARKAGLH